MTDIVETRATPLMQPSKGSRTLTGYAAVFDSPTVIAGLFSERIARGAFAKALKGDVHCVLDHDFGRVVGRTKSGTLRLSEDSRGLKIEVDLPETPDGQTALELVRRGDLDGMSFQFSPVVESWDDSGRLPARTLHEVDLFEVSIVARPAYDDTSISLRTADAMRARMAADVLRRQAGSRK